MIVETKYGRLRGVDFDTYVEYRSVPYAKPPVGERRWKAPEPMDNWEGVYDADTYRGCCVQEDESDEFYTKEFYSVPEYRRSQDEDCLYLNIWVPKEIPQVRKCPVAFWIHGGAFACGHNSEMEFDGKAYCDRGVILVSVEYRCNVFGFLAHRWLAAENAEHLSGNYGILDQVMGLKWVYENIAAFGGDPDNITIFGQSAGAMSVQTLVSSDLTGDMIAKAIMQSGGSYGAGLHRDITQAEQERYGEIFADILGVRSLEEMRARSTQEIKEAMVELIARTNPRENGMFLMPGIDGKLMAEGYYTLMDKGRIKDIPYMLGSTADDIMVTPEQKANGEDPLLFRGVLAFCKKLVELGRKPAYAYYFTRELPGDNSGAFHSSELWYMFGTLDRCWRPMEDRDYALSRKMLDYWTNFMKTGDPNGNNLPIWNPCREKADVMELS